MPPAMTTVGTVLKGIVSGKSIKTLERPPLGNEFAILKVSAVTWGEFRPYESKAMPPDYDPGDCPRAMDGDILISRANTRELVGAPVMVRGDHPQLLLSDKLLKLIPDEAVVDRRYLVRALRSPAATLHFSQRAGGSSGSMTNITQSDIREAPIPLPPLREQRSIADILDKADALRVKRKEALAHLDRLTQSIFVEMFGDPATNPKGWPICRIRDLLESASYGTSAKAGPEGEFPVLRMNNITRTGEMDFTDLKYMDLREGEHERFLVRKGDVLFNRTNSAELVGKTAIFRGAERVAYAGYLVRLRVTKENDAEYLAGFLNTPYAKRTLRGMCKSIIGMANINATEVQAMQIAAPPSHVQGEFGRRIDRVQKLKAVHRVAAAELDTLFATLQHSAFSGELLDGFIREKAHT